MISRLSFLPVIALLAACGQSGEPASKASESATAEGEVLGGTISDDMLPLESVRSVAPPMSPEPESPEASSGETAAAVDEPVAEETESAEAAEPADEAG